jgi:hypothetical protein
MTLMDGRREARLGSQLPGGQIVLRRHSEGVGDAVEEGKHRRDIHCLRDLVFRPPMVAQFLYVIGRGAVRRFGNFFNVVEQDAFCWRQPSFIQLAFENGFYALITGSLNTQEVGMTVESIRAAIEEGDVAGDHLFVTAIQMSLREVHGVGEIHHLPKEVGTRAKALDDARYLRSSRAGTPVVVRRSRIAGGVAILRHADLGRLRGIAGALRGKHRRFLFFHDDGSYLVCSLEQELQRNLNHARTDIGVDLPEGRRTDITVG